MKTVLVSSLTELEAFAREVLASVRIGENATVIALRGDLGAGKTAFVKACAKILGITNEVTSPTFVVMKSYAVEDLTYNISKLVHIDAYRIESDDEMRVLGLHEILDEPSTLVCIEWPEKIGELIGARAIHLTLKILEGDTRRITYGE